MYPERKFSIDTQTIDLTHRPIRSSFGVRMFARCVVVWWHPITAIPVVQNAPALLGDHDISDTNVTMKNAGILCMFDCFRRRQISWGTSGYSDWKRTNKGIMERLNKLLGCPR